jgi:hypothetical protein
MNLWCVMPDPFLICYKSISVLYNALDAGPTDHPARNPVRPAAVGKGFFVPFPFCESGTGIYR